MSPGVFGSNDVVGSFAVTAGEMANTSAPEVHYPSHSGWQMRIAGEGGLATIVASPGGTGYANTDTVTVSGGSANASATVSTNSTGGILTLNVATPGLFANVGSLSFSAKAANGSASAGSGATFSGTLGGRAGRVQYECIMACGSITSSSNTIPG